MNPIELTGITWNSTRGRLPLLATASRFSESHPGITITWQRRSLQQFADAPLDQLCRDFDLVVFDHPWLGTVSEGDLLLPLDAHLPTAYLRDGYLALAMGSVPRLGELLACPALRAYTEPESWMEQRNRICLILESHLAAETTEHWLGIVEPADVWCARGARLEPTLRASRLSDASHGA